jgi:hypothetical protein
MGRLALKEAPMRPALILACALALSAEPAAADGLSSSGAGALALAALVAAHSPAPDSQQKQALAAMLDGKLNFSSNAPIAVATDSIACRQSDVDISYHDCTLKFGAATRLLNGRVAHELYATLIENGVPPDGAAGSSYESVSHLACTINLAEVKQKGGGGATSAWAPGP